MKRAFVFPGQGSQHPGMGRDLAEAFSAARVLFEEVDDALSQHLSRLMFDGPESDLTLTENAQPALLAASLAVIRVLEAEASFDISKYTGAAKVILTALKKYGMFVADNGSDFYLSGETNTSWNGTDLNQLKKVPGNAVGLAVRGVEIYVRLANGTTAASVLGVVSEKPLYFGYVVVAILALPLVWWRQGWTATSLLLTFNAALFGLYNIFIFTTYITVFPTEMSSAAHSYFRYNTQLSLVLVLSLALTVRDLGAAARIWERPLQAANAAALGLTLLAPIAFAKRLRFDLDMPQPLVWDLAKKLTNYLSDGGRLALLLPGDNDSVATMISPGRVVNGRGAGGSRGGVGPSGTPDQGNHDA